MMPPFDICVYNTFFLSWPSCKWVIIFVSVIWIIWKNRNKESIENIQPSCFESELAIHTLISDLNVAFPQKISPSKSPVVPKAIWVKPPTGWAKLNTDASVKLNPLSVSIGGLIRNVAGVLRKIGSCHITTAELWAFERRIGAGLEQADSLAVCGNRFSSYC